MASPAPANALPELALDTTARLDRLMQLASRAWNDTGRLVDVSRIDGVSLRPKEIYGGSPWRWGPLPAEQQPLADAAMDTLRAWLEAAERVIQLNEATLLEDFQEH